MNKSRKAQTNARAASVPGGKKLPIAALTVIALAAALVWGVWRSGSPPAALRSASDPTAAAGAAKTGRSFQELVGRWVRPDGGYVLEIKSAQDNGPIEAAYFNPNPIHVARAEASREGSTVKVFIELRDENYPGSTYMLTHDVASDQLRGIYYQAVEHEQYSIFFQRLK
jgi:hypothetical protein